MDMEFSPRMRQILLIMLREDRTISVKYLAEQMNLSRRTVQRELEYLGRPLKKYGLEFCSKTGTDWGNEKVKLVIGIAGAGEDHLEILAAIADRMATPEAVDRLAGCSEEEIYRTFTGKEMAS